jgi:N-formylglutamate amidohydrolase
MKSRAGQPTFDAPQTQVLRAGISRLVVDVERFEEDAHEPMAARGMGAICSVTSSLKPLRRRLHAVEREALMQTCYRPHHACACVEAAVSAAIDLHERCLVTDCHSFPCVALPCELADPDDARPDIGIGSDDFHTSAEAAGAFVESFRREGWRVSLNEPFAGALVPQSRYRQDHRVHAIMVEINRRHAGTS